MFDYMHGSIDKKSGSAATAPLGSGVRRQFRRRRAAHAGGLVRGLFDLLELRLYSAAAAFGSGNLVAQGDEFLGRGRVDGHGAVELFLGRAAGDGDGERLNDLGRVGADHVATEHAVVVRSMTSFIMMRSSRPESVYFIGRKRVR